jgi:hypothetical protein
MSFRNLSRSNHARLFQLAVLWFSALSLWPVWRFRFPSMQDYPQHLFISYLLSTFDNPSFDWGKHYVVALKADPYNLFYYITKFFHLFCDIETSGKLFISIYIILVALLVLRASRSLNDAQTPPWGLLLLFPFSFSQIYFLGFTNYLISVPLLFLVLLDLERLVSLPLSAGSILQHSLYQFLLFITHPYTVLLYLGFAFAGSSFYFSEVRRLKKAFFAPLLLALFFLLWYGSSYSPGGVPQTAEQGIRWLPVEETLGFFMLMFTGMHWTDGVYWPTTLIWLMIMGLFVISGVVRRKEIAIPWKMASFFFLSLLGFSLLPFWLTYYSYFNLRIAPVSYFFLAMVLSRIKLSGKAAFMVVSLVTGLMLLSSNLQEKLSQETAEVMPLFAKMEKNATILPLMLDSSAAGLDPAFFEFHKHEPSYYHIFVGGGVTPALFSSPLLPVQYKPGVTLPVPTDFKPASLQAYAPYYRYLLIRGAPDMYIWELSHYYNLAGRSGKWSLFESPLI